MCEISHSQNNFQEIRGFLPPQLVLQDNLEGEWKLFISIVLRDKYCSCIMHWVAFCISLILSPAVNHWCPLAHLSQAPTIVHCSSCVLACTFLLLLLMRPPCDTLWLVPCLACALCLPLTSFSSCHCVSCPFSPCCVVPSYSSPYVSIPLLPTSSEVELMLISFCVVEYKSIH